MMTDNPFVDFYTAHDICMAALAANDIKTYISASLEKDAALSRIMPQRVPGSWKDTDA